ncbi:MAG: glycosyltransferase, partial [Lentisphaeraceae bacterium]|nr:glycosyltransferase [Lentisphaeraceae bacterium]
MKIVVIMPTYNERENIGKMIPILMNEIFPNMQEDMHLLVVDDNSPDGTKEVVIQLQKEYPTLNLITGQKQGLGSAYIRGMTHAMEELKADAIMEMDADFSHDPTDIPRLIDELKNHDFVIGSRYVPGGQIPPEWTLYRQMNSKFGNVAARHIAGMSAVKDCTAGFRAIRTDL